MKRWQGPTTHTVADSNARCDRQEDIGFLPAIVQPVVVNRFGVPHFLRSPADRV